MEWVDLVQTQMNYQQQTSIMQKLQHGLRYMIN